VKDGYTADEAETGKQALLEERKIARSEDGTLAEELVMQAYLGRTWTFAAQTDTAIAALTPAQINAVLRKFVRPSDIAYVYAGDFAKR
jgi:zinc protease